MDTVTVVAAAEAAAVVVPAAWTGGPRNCAHFPQRPTLVSLTHKEKIKQNEKETKQHLNKTNFFLSSSKTTPCAVWMSHLQGMPKPVFLDPLVDRRVV